MDNNDHISSYLVKLGLAYPPQHLKQVEDSIHPEKSIYKKIESRSIEYGQGVVARETIKKGELIASFCGEKKEFNAYPFFEKAYLLPYSDRLWLNPVGTLRYVNHSCNPNMELKNKTDLYALRDIAIDEALSFRYDTVVVEPQMDEAGFIEEARWDPAFTFVCLCGSPNCLKIIDRNRKYVAGAVKVGSKLKRQDARLASA